MGIDVAGESRRWRIRCCGQGLRKSVSIGGDTVVLELKERTDTVQQLPPNDVTRLSRVIVPFQSEFLDCIPR